MKTFLSQQIFFETMCNFSLRVVNRFVIFSINVFSVVEELIARKFKSWNLMGKKNSLRIGEDFSIND
jgi:hypothetical protein